MSGCCSIAVRVEKMVQGICGSKVIYPRCYGLFLLYWSFLVFVIVVVVGIVIMELPSAGHDQGCNAFYSAYGEMDGEEENKDPLIIFYWDSPSPHLSSPPPPPHTLNNWNRCVDQTINYGH